MKFPLSWLKEYVHLHQPSAEIARILTLAGIEVDAILKEPLPFNAIIVGKVLDVQKHPNADKLCVAQVTDGKQEHQVVCGAPNCRTGLKVAFAPIGATLTDEQGKKFKIKNTKIRGVDSFGMLCSSEELGMEPDGTDGIMELPPTLIEGQDLSDLYSDSVFEVAITPNLGHCASLIGASRELSAATGLPLHLPKNHLREDQGEVVQEHAKVEMQAGDDCPRYTCRIIRDCKVGPSPEWLQKRLEACGLRSVNNVVDITNYVLLETGHPLHAFDEDKLAGHQIVIRYAKEGERLVTLDERERKLSPTNLLICDRDKPIALAGIMGGLATEVTDTTVNVLLESAYFRSGSIRKTSKEHGLKTDASKHYERGVDPNGLVFALDRATMLIQEICGGKVASHLIDIKERTFPEKEILCRLSRIHQVLGIPISLSEVETIFKRLGFSSMLHASEVLLVKVPTFRVDISTEIDLVEEVARLYGFENFDRKPALYHTSTLPDAPIFLFEREIRSRLMAEGLQEFLTCDLIGPSLLALAQDKSIEPDSIVHVLNPVSIEQSILRVSMLPGLLQVVKYNVDHQNHDVSGFEVGKIHFKNEAQYKEQSVAGIILSGMRRPYHCDDKPKDYDFYDLKGIVENVLEEIGIKDVRFKENAKEAFHTGRQAAIFVGTLAVGSLGEIHPTIQRQLDVPQRIYYAEINLHDLFQVRKKTTKMVDLALYPASERDWTITLKEETSVSVLFDILYKIESRLLEDVTLIDIYRSDKLGKEHKNVTLHFVYRDQAKTIAAEEVDSEHERVTNEVLNALGKVVI